MKTWNPSMRSGGTRATEANREAAVGQFEGATVEGGGAAPLMPGEDATAQVPATPSGTGTGSTGATASDVQDITQCSDQEYWDGSGCKSIYTTDPGTNVTPWQDKSNQARDLILAGAILGLIAGILYGLSEDTGQETYWGIILMVLSFVFLIACIACAVAAIALGVQINDMGGSPQGTIDIVAGAAVIIAALLAMFSDDYDTYGNVALAIIGIFELISMLL